MFAELATCQIGGEDAGPGTDSHRTYYVSSWCTSAGRVSTLARLYVPACRNYAASCLRLLLCRAGRSQEYWPALGAGNFRIMQLDAG
ncbi:hypothetical protein Zmor_012854 [Zophobas morio]|uniref:Uncharacterized protein n=1 Tax=Zophobas morio TaxID=2755281 RepID=A0AA38IEK4_9CUCU|nr:hypothetical protein Zmor_012854 [Zophobas morio]